MAVEEAAARTSDRPIGYCMGVALASTENTNVQISWEEHGSPEAPPILLVMGHVFGSKMWHRTTPVLANGYRVLTYDNWGIGASQCPPGPHTIARMAEDALTVLDGAGVDRAHVYGVSMGGLVAQELALVAPDRVGALVLGCTGCPSGDNMPGRPTPSLSYRVPRSLLYRLGRGTMYGSAASRIEVDEDLRILRATRTTAQGLIAQSRAIHRYRSYDRVPAITAPTLVLHGDEDRVVPLERGRELAERIPSARLEALPGGGHNFSAGCASLANALVLDFLTEHPLTARNGVAAG